MTRRAVVAFTVLADFVVLTAFFKALGIIQGTPFERGSNRYAMWRQKDRRFDVLTPRACGLLTESGFPNRLSSDSRCVSGGLGMTRPYSEDLRERAVARFEAGETIRSIGKAFGIDPSCVPKWVKRRRETGSVAPAAIGGRKPRTLSGNVAVWLRERISLRSVHDAGPGGRTGGAWDQDRSACGLDFRSRGRVEFQKKACSPASRIGQTSRANVNAGRRVRPASIQPVSSSSTRLGSRRI